MAKSKKSPKKEIDEEEPISQETDAEVDFDADAVDADAEVPEEEAEAEAEAEADAEAEDADVSDDGDDADVDDEEAEAPPPRPKPKVTYLTIALMLLNWIAAPAFFVMAYVDHRMHLDYSYRALLNYTQIWGMPLKGELLGDKTIGGEEDFNSIYNETRPIMRQTHEQLAAALKKRPGTKSIGKDLFVPVEEPVPIHLRPSDMSPLFLLDLYGSAVPEKERYKTLEDAIIDLRTRVKDDISAAATEIKTTYEKKKEEEKRKFVKESIFIMTWDSELAKKKEEEIDNADAKTLDDLVKRSLVQKTLYPLAPDYKTLKSLDDALAKASGAELDTFLDDALQRRMYYDILAPLNAFRPGDVKMTDIERIADRDKVKLEGIKELLDKRFTAAISSKMEAADHLGKDYWGNPQERNSVEKRQQVAFILFDLAHVQVPMLDKKLYAKGIERAQTVSGLYEFTNASLAYVGTLRRLEQSLAARITANRDGNTFGPPGKEMNGPGFLSERRNKVDRLHRIVEDVDAAQKRLDELKQQRDHAQKIYDQRIAQHKVVTEKLIKARKETARDAKELREFQDQLHEALLELSDAADTNFRLEREIRALELSYFQTPPNKGGKR
ncbi:MAG TPA: hypothetical protein VFE62_21935 [Gemmataceae bacterium]|nr:hypothetical protein [Gemmataceae bacterium]